MSVIDISCLEVSFGKGPGTLHAVQGVSFHVPDGYSFGLVGESGSGKSTVLKAICGLVPFQKGRISVQDMILTGKRNLDFYKQVQMVFQDPYGSLHPRHTVDRILSEPLAIHKFDKGEQRIIAALEEVGLSADFRFRYSHQLSGGQRQRIAIARALILEPRILLLDEPTSALDVSVQAEVLNLLDGLRQRHGLTYILVSHDLGVVAHMCDQVAVMNNGIIVEELTATVLRAGQASQPYTLQLLKASIGYDRKVIDGFTDFSDG